MLLRAKPRLAFHVEHEVVRAEPYELVWRTVPSWLYPDSTEWALRLARVEGGTRIEQTFQVVKGTKLEPVYAMLVGAHRDRSHALEQDLQRIGALALEAEVRRSVGSRADPPAS